MRYRLGLTGSIGMGKSTTAQLFQDQGCVIWDADAAVHRLYSSAGRAVEPVSARFPDAVVDGAVSRGALRNIIARDPEALPAIEQIVHPLVQQDRAEFVANHPDDIGVFDIPLLFETGAESEMDAVICVSVSPEIQRKRVLDRGSMIAEDLDRILARQMPNTEKCARADVVIETDTLEHARTQVQSVLAKIDRRLANA